MTALADLGDALADPSVAAFLARAIANHATTLRRNGVAPPPQAARLVEMVAAVRAERAAEAAPCVTTRLEPTDVTRASENADDGHMRTKRQVAQYLRCSERTVERMVASGQITAYRIGKRGLRFRLSDLDRAH